MHILLGILLAIGLFCWWLSGNWYAWAVAFTAGALPAVGLALLVLSSLHDPGPNAPIALVGSIAFVPFWWLLTGIPYRLRVRPRLLTPAAARAGSD